MLTQSRTAQLLQGQTTLTRKVYDVVPISQRWTQAQVAGELARVGKAAIDSRTLSHCLTTLVEAGVISRVDGMYMREPCRPDPVRRTILNDSTLETPMSKAQSTVTLVQPSKPIVVNPVDRLGKIAAMLRGAADEVDELALEVQQTLEVNQADLSKLKQLQDIIQSLR